MVVWLLFTHVLLCQVLQQAHLDRVVARMAGMRLPKPSLQEGGVVSSSALEREDAGAVTETALHRDDNGETTTKTEAANAVKPVATGTPMAADSVSRALRVRTAQKKKSAQY